MSYILGYSVLFATAISFTLGAIRYAAVNRTFMLMHRGIFEASAVSVDKHGNPIHPVYDEKRLIRIADDYLKKNLRRYVTSVEINYRFYNPSDGTVCFSECRAVKISLGATINYLFRYEAARTFTIVEAKR